MGNPHPDTWPIYCRAWGTDDRELIRRKLGDDLRWIRPGAEAYRHPEGRPIFEWQRRGRDLSAAGRFADCDSVAEVEDAPWPDPAYVDHSETLAQLAQAGPYYRAGGWWSSFFHDVSDFFGMENYFIKMHTDPQVVHAVTRRVVNFYLDANALLYAQAGSKLDALFFGNDFGTQQDLLISPGMFDEFVRPYMKQLVDQAKAASLQVILHSCGAISRAIPSLIALGIDGLHPLQAAAAGMDADSLGEQYRGQVAFLGGIDTQHLLVHGSLDDVRQEVRRVVTALGPSLVISPSHEALLPNIPPENIRAMAEAVQVVATDE
jgi:uroporphyrinogen decarboxylase